MAAVVAVVVAVLLHRLSADVEAASVQRV